MAWNVKTTGGFASDSTEAIENAYEIYGLLSARGWTINAVAGLLGNMGAESGYNPWRWQNDEVLKSTQSPWTNHGYGLTQFTPGGKYINAASSYSGYGPNFADRQGKYTDGIAQILFLDEHADYYKTAAFPFDYAAYKSSTENPGYLARAWLYNYERPLDPTATEAQREAYGIYWWEILSGATPPTPPEPPEPPEPTVSTKLNFILYGRRRL